MSRFLTLLTFFVLSVAGSEAYSYSQCLSSFWVSADYRQGPRVIDALNFPTFLQVQQNELGKTDEQLNLDILHQVIDPSNPFYDHVRFTFSDQYRELNKNSYDGQFEVITLNLAGEIRWEAINVHLINRQLSENDTYKMRKLINIALAKSVKKLDLFSKLKSAYEHRDLFRHVLMGLIDISRLGIMVPDSYQNYLDNQGKRKRKKISNLKLGEVDKPKLKGVFRQKNYYSLKDKIFSRAQTRQASQSFYNSNTSGRYNESEIGDLLAGRLLVRSTSPLVFFDVFEKKNDHHQLMRNIENELGSSFNGLFKKLKKNQHAGFRSGELLDVDFESKKSGYEAIHLTIELNGERRELQIMSVAMNRWHSWEHNVYKQKDSFADNYRYNMNLYTGAVANLLKTWDYQQRRKILNPKWRIGRRPEINNDKPITLNDFKEINANFSNIYGIRSEHLFPISSIEDLFTGQ